MQGAPTSNSIAIARRCNAADGVSPPQNGVRKLFNSLLGAYVHRNESILMSLLHDTTREAAAIQDEIIQRMSGEERLKLALEMTHFSRQLAATRIRNEHPEWTEREVTVELLRYAFNFKNLPPPLL